MFLNSPKFFSIVKYKAELQKRLDYRLLNSPFFSESKFFQNVFLFKNLHHYKS